MVNNGKYDCETFSFFNDEKYFVRKSSHQSQSY